MSEPPSSGQPPINPPMPESERTVVRPRPGARAAAGDAGGGMPQMPMPASMGIPDDARVADPLAGFAEPLSLKVGNNPILEHAYKLLAIVRPIRNLPQHPNPAALKEQLTQGVREFEAGIRKSGVPNEKVVAARYILCTFLDETAASTPWGGVGVWASDTLLVRFHNETWGGEKVFVLLSRLAESPGPNLDLLELIYACIALGFEGRYRIIDQGRTQLETVRERLYQLIRQQRPEPHRRLSLNWAPAKLTKRSWMDAAPFWAVATVALLVVLGGYALYAWLIGNRSDPVFASISSLRLTAVKPVVIVPPPAPPKPRFAGLLEEEQRSGLLAVRESAGQSVITMKGDGFFAPGSAQLPDKVLPTIERIGKALAQHQGTILISGHTDSQPIRTLRFPSNWHLSQERAKTVQTVLSRHLDPARMRSEGRADSEPVASNDTAENRARNRRVDITLFTTN